MIRQEGVSENWSRVRLLVVSSIDNCWCTCLYRVSMLIRTFRMPSKKRCVQRMLETMTLTGTKMTLLMYIFSHLHSSIHVFFPFLDSYSVAQTMNAISTYTFLAARAFTHTLRERERGGELHLYAKTNKSAFPEKATPPPFLFSCTSKPTAESENQQKPNPVTTSWNSKKWGCLGGASTTALSRGWCWIWICITAHLLTLLSHSLSFWSRLIWSNIASYCHISTDGM